MTTNLKVHAAVYSLPSTLSYVPRGGTAPGANQYTYGSYGLDYYAPNLQPDAVIENITAFNGVWRVSKQSDWNFTVAFKKNDPRLRVLREAVENPGAVVAFSLADRDSDYSELAGFLGGTFNVPAVGGFVYNNVPDFALRGGSGNVYRHQWTDSDRDSGVTLGKIFVRDWLQTLKETLHTNFSTSDLRENQRAVLWVVMRRILEDNSEFDRSVQDSATSTVPPFGSGRAAAAARTHKTFNRVLDGETLTDAEMSSGVPTQVGRWLIRPSFSSNTVADLFSNTTVHTQKGSHNTLISFQRILESRGLFMEGNLQLLRVFAPSTEVRVLGDNEYRSGTVTRIRPEANRWVIKYADGTGRDWTLYVDNIVSQRVWGPIEKNLAPAIPRIEGADDDIGDDALLDLLLGQAAARSVAEDNAVTMEANLDYRVGVRVGLDLKMGDLLDLDLVGGGGGQQAMREYSAKLAGSDKWDFKIGLGNVPGLLPGYRVENEYERGVVFGVEKNG